MGTGVAILGIFVADVAFRAARLPRMGETILGAEFKLGPGGKGANQAVAAARAGARVSFVTKLGQDTFAEMARRTWGEEGIDMAHVSTSPTTATGAAFIFVDEATGDNAIIVVSGAAGELSPADVERAEAAIAGAAVFVTQLEQPPAAAQRGLEIARAAGVATVFNPAPAVAFDEGFYRLCDYVTPNESEASALTGIEVADIDSARHAGDALLAKGVGCALITLGEKGALFHDANRSELVPAFRAGPVVETTGAGDAFNGGFAAALAEGLEPLAAARFGCAVGSLSVTRAGTAPSMPRRGEIDRLLGS